jgi:hypothetical protein
MTRVRRISLSVAVALFAGIIAQLTFGAALDHRPPAGSTVILLTYLIGGLPGLLFDPILLVIEGAAFTIIYNLLPK